MSPIGGPQLLSIEELADGGADSPLLGGNGIIDRPVIFVDLAAVPSPAVLARAVERARTRDRLLIGFTPGPHEAISELVPCLDLTVVGEAVSAEPTCVRVTDPAACVGELHEATSRNPQAAFVLASTLRMTSRLPVPEALDAESFAYSTLLGGPEFATWLAARGRRPLPPVVENPVLAERNGDVLHITLNRPERRNAYGRQLRDALVEALHIAVADRSVERVVLDGAGPVFCAGGDLAEFGTTPDLTLAHFVRTRGGAGRLMHVLRARTEVRLHGSCVGAGIEVPAFAASITADPAATFRLPEVAMGLIPGAGGTVSIPRRIGRWRTFYLALSGKPIPAPLAAEWGLIDGLTPGT